MTATINGKLVFNHLMRARMDAIGYYQSGTKAVYADMLPQLVKILIKRTKVDHYQNVIIVEGRTGSGKSTLAVQLAKMIDPRFDLSQDYIYDTADLLKKLERVENEGISKVCPVSLFDEGTVILNSKSSLAKENKNLMVLLQTMRSLNWTTIICVPLLRNLDKDIREQMVDYLIKCPEKPLIARSYDENGKEVKFTSRGFFEVYLPKFPKFSTNTNHMYWQLIGAGVYGALDDKTDREYQAIKLKHQLAFIKNYENAISGKKKTKKESEE